MLPPDAPLQSIIDPFVKGMGGELIGDLINQKNPPPNADYLFRRHNVIAELKTLRVNSFGEAFQQKLAAQVTDWHRRRRLLVYGRARIDSRRLDHECQRDLWNLMAIPPLQKQVVLAADGQIRSTKQLLKMPAAKGLLWVASDGNRDLQPDAVWFLLNRIFQKKKKEGTSAYSHIDGLAYFNPRMLVHMPNTKEPTMLWLSGMRQNGGPQMQVLLKELSEGWPQYVEWAQGIPVRRLDENEALPETLRFVGVTPKVPTIRVGDPGQASPRRP